ncbi:MAG: hypothetical protein QG594_1377, partial [Bacteroidota bacterium]|nr:hypothetical protein [Bacteroidota bacterium]
MTVPQINFYKSLDINEQYVLNILAMRIVASSLSDLTQLQEKLKYKNKLTQAKMTTLFEKAIKEKILEYNPIAKHAPFKPSFDFVLYVFPIIDNKEQWDVVLKYKNWHENSNSSEIYTRKYLYCLLHDKKDYLPAEKMLLNYTHRKIVFNLINEIAAIPAYEKHFSVMSDEFYNNLCEEKINNLFFSLTPLDSIKNEIKKLRRPSSKEILDVFDAFCSLEKGDFINTKTAPHFDPEIEAIRKIYLGDYETASALFLKTMKAQQQRVKTAQFPLVNFFAFYYMLTIANMDPEKSSTLILKMIKGLEKSSAFDDEKKFLAVLYNLTNQSNLRDRSLIGLNSIILSNNNQYTTLICISIYYLTDCVPSKATMPTIYRTIAKAIESGYTLLALEAAFAYKAWLKNKDGEELLALAQKQSIHPPALSRIAKTENWEKTLNALLSLNLGKNAAKNAVTKGSRVVYFVDFGKSNNIQPVLQTAQKNGWSGGRNIAMKSFAAGTTADMTEQDYRIAKTIRRYNSGYYGSEEYEFTEN